MNKFSFYCFALLGLLLVNVACKSKSTMIISIDKQLTLLNIPSASGIENDGESLWVIGDDSPFIFQMNKEYQIKNKYTISKGFTIEQLNATISKDEKKDFEAMTLINWEDEKCIFLFGSGSKSPQRNDGLLISLQGNVIETFDLSAFYELIQKDAKLDEEDFNIEAAAILEDKLYLFNRGKNKLISMKTEHFIEYINGKKASIKIKENTIELPSLNGVKAGFSGATIDVENKRILFSASVENTSNWVDDGAVYGSYIGIIVPSELQHHYTPECALLEKDKTLLIKVESLTIIESSKEKTKIVAVTDSDGSVSKLLEVTIRY
jgi:hypothetical protein